VPPTEVPDDETERLAAPAEPMRTLVFGQDDESNEERTA
jgi:hypothetical protein